MRLETRRNSADMLGKETAVERDQLGNIDNGLRAQSRHAAWQQNIARCARKRQVACNRRNDDSADAAFIERIRLNYEDRPRESRLRTARLRQVRPPDLAALHIRHGLPTLFGERFQHRVFQRRIELRVVLGEHLIQAFGHRFGAMPVQIFR